MEQEKILFEILDKNKDTDYGKRYAFGNMRTVKAFQNCVPITKHESYAPMIELMTRLGEYSIFTAHDLECYMEFLGAGWKVEKIPCTKEYASLCFELMSELMTGRDRNLILFSSLPRENKSRDGLYSNTIYGTILEKWREWRNHSLAAKLLGYGHSVLPDELLFPNDTEDYTYEKALFALESDSITQIIAPNTFDVLDLLQFIQKNWNRLITDIERGTITDSTLDQDIRDALLENFSSNAERAEELKSLKEVSDLKQIWPNLNHIAADGSNRMEIYTNQLRRYTPDIEIDYNCSFTAESIYAKNIPGTEQYVLLENMNFYEFLPAENIWDEDRESKLVLTDDLQEGKYYEMFVTTPYGFYRYELGEVIYIVKKSPDSIVFTKEYNNEDTVTVKNIYITQKQFSDAVISAQNKLGINIDDFYTIPEENNLMLMAEVRDKNGISQENLASAIDNALRESVPQYAEIRNKHGYMPLKIMWMQPQTQSLLRDISRFKKYAPDDLFRPIRYPREQWLVDVLMTLTEN